MNFFSISPIYFHIVLYQENTNFTSSTHLNRTHSIKSSPSLFDEQIPVDNSPHAEHRNCTRSLTKEENVNDVTC